MSEAPDRKGRLNRLVERFWVLRGVAAAIAVMEGFDKFTSLDKYEFLRAFHALLVGWNRVAAFVGRMIGYLPFLPHYSANEVNALLFASTVGIPTVYEYTHGIGAVGGGMYPARRFWFILLLPLYYFLYLMVFEVAPHSIMDWLRVSLISAFCAFHWIVALVTMKGYRRGLVYTLTFVLTMQCLYWSHTPWLKNKIDTLTASVLGPEQREATTGHGDK